MRQLFLAALLAFSVLPSVHGATLAPLPPQDQYKAMLIEGDSIPRALNKKIDVLSLQAVVDGHMEPIPYQIDEYNTGGALYFPELEVPLDGTAGVLDPNDKLLFLYKDAGVRRDPRFKTDGKVLSEVELTDPKGVRRYVYIIEGSRLRSEEQYVRYSAEMAQVETDFYSLVYNRKNQINWDDFSYAGYGGAERPLDSMKLRMTGGVVTKLSTVTLNNDNFVAKPMGEHVGPIRTTSQMNVTVWLFNLPLLDVSYQVHHYPKSMLYDVRMVMPEVRRKALADPRLTIALDANNLVNGVIRTSIGPVKGAPVDGTMGPEETAIAGKSMPLDNNWIWLSTRKNFDVLAFFNFLGESREPLSLVYLDDAKRVDAPERFTGSVPMAGYRIDNFPAGGFFGFTVSMFLNESFAGDPAVFTETVRSQPAIRVLSAAE